MYLLSLLEADTFSLTQYMALRGKRMMQPSILKPKRAGDQILGGFCVTMVLGNPEHLRYMTIAAKLSMLV